jgi:hypothetical protein
LHLTVLSLFTAEDFEPFFAQKERYIAAVGAALNPTAPQGNTKAERRHAGGLESITLIDSLFQAAESKPGSRAVAHLMQFAGFEEALDHYGGGNALENDANRHPERFAVALERARGRPFGVTTIRSFSLVENDWYMSRHATVSLKRFIC